MQYCPIDDEIKPHLIKLLDWMLGEVIRSGGDGDALWYSKFYDIKDILILVQEYNKTLKYEWTIGFDENRKRIFWGNGEEGIVITNNEDAYKNAPRWQQCIVVN